MPPPLASRVARGVRSREDNLSEAEAKEAEAVKDHKALMETKRDASAQRRPRARVRCRGASASACKGVVPPRAVNIVSRRPSRRSSDFCAGGQLRRDLSRVRTSLYVVQTQLRIGPNSAEAWPNPT